MVSWFVAYTQPNKERQAACHLRNQQFHVYLPLYRKMRRHAGKTEQVLSPLFPRYVFVGTDEDQRRWRSVNGTIGVSSIVMAADQPLSVPESVLNEIKSREIEDGVVQLAWARFKHGQSVRILQGSMSELEALFDEATGADRGILLVSMLGRMVRMQVPLDFIEAA